MKPYYQHGGVTIYHGDCRQLLPALTADLLLTDPPYGIGEARGKNKSRSKPTHCLDKNGHKTTVYTKDYGNKTWDDQAPADWLFSLMRAITKHQVIFGGNYFPLPPSKCWLVWDKENGDNGFADCELAWTNFDCAVRRIVWRWNGMLRQGNEPRFHPTQKPLQVMKWALSLAPETTRTVLDPFMGSGTSLVAAKCFGQPAIGIEQDESYCETAAMRLEQEMIEFRREKAPCQQTLASPM